MRSLLYELQLDVDQAKGEIIASFHHEQKILETHAYSPNGPFAKQLFDPWLLNIHKIIFYHDHFESIDFKITIKSQEIFQELGTTINGFLSMLQNTQALIKKYKPLLKDSADFDGHFFYNVDNLNTFEELHQEVSGKIPGKIFYGNSSSGWNKVSRTWEQSSGFDIDQLTGYILKNRIRHVYSVNMYYLVHLMKSEQIFPLPFFKSIGVEWVAIDYDTYNISEYGLIQKSALNCPQFRRFSSLPDVAAHFDREYQNTNITYFMLGDAKKQSSAMPLLKGPADVVIISQARIQDCLENFPEALFFLEHTRPDDLYLDFQKLYYALIHLLFHDKTISKREQEHRFIHLSKIHLHALSLLKYDVIQSLLDKKIVPKIYGDQYWASLFPGAYQNKFLNELEMEDLFKSQKSLYLLLNPNYSYFQNNPAFLRAINLNVPYLCFPAVVKKDDIQGMGLLEYKNGTELVEKLPRVNQLIRDQAYLKSLDTLRNEVSACRRDFHDLLLQPQNRKEGYFSRLAKEHESLLTTDLQSYFKQNHERIFLAYDKLSDGSASKFPLHQSRWAKASQRTFFHALCEIYVNIGARKAS